jgi:hypothetical protein
VNIDFQRPSFTMEDDALLDHALTHVRHRTDLDSSMCIIRKLNRKNCCIVSWATRKGLEK